MERQPLLFSATHTKHRTSSNQQRPHPTNTKCSKSSLIAILLVDLLCQLVLVMVYKECRQVSLMLASIVVTEVAICVAIVAICYQTWMRLIFFTVIRLATSIITCYGLFSWSTMILSTVGGVEVTMSFLMAIRIRDTVEKRQKSNSNRQAKLLLTL